MRLQVHAVHDRAVNAFLQPFHSRTRGEAVRSFMLAVTGPTNDFKANPEDYALYYLGDYDDGEGVYYSCQPSPEKVMTATDCLAMQAK